MPPPLALLLTFGFIVFLFRRESKESVNVTGNLWIPLIWVLLIGSRSASQWLLACGINMGQKSMEEGNPLDALIYCVLIVLAFRVLAKRGVNISEVAKRNKWITVYLVYCFLSIAWSDFAYVAFKRWIKIQGHPIMVLVVLTEPDPLAALIRLMKRAAYFLAPLSITLIKYFPNVSREFDPFTGAAMNSGVTIHKNLLGCDAMILGLFFFWHWLNVRQMEKSRARRDELVLIGAFACMIAWLLVKARSSTSIGSFAIGVIAILILGLRTLNLRRVGTYAIAAFVVGGLLEWMFGISSLVIEMLGRNSTLTGRTSIWREVIALQPNAILGAGFESFWLGDRLDKMAALHWWRPNEAHNGYLETYLSLGVVGVFLIIGLIFVAFRNSKAQMLVDFEPGRFRLGLLAAFVFYNWTEAAFKGLSFILFMFYIVAIDYPWHEGEVAADLPDSAPAGEDAELVDNRAGGAQVQPN
jgi:exopolysaccharide production protein ExoQ